MCTRKLSFCGTQFFFSLLSLTLGFEVNIWDILTQRPPTWQPRQSATFWDVEEQAEEDLQDKEQDYGYDDDETEETIQSQSRRRPRPNVLNHDDEEDDNQEPFNTPKSSAEHSLFITQPDP